MQLVTTCRRRVRFDALRRSTSEIDSSPFSAARPLFRTMRVVNSLAEAKVTFSRQGAVVIAQRLSVASTEALLDTLSERL